MFPSSFRPVSANRRLRKLSNVHSPMCIMSCVRFGNFFSRQICKVFFSWNAFVRWFSHLSWGTKALRAIQAQATCIGATTCCWLASVVLQSVLSRRTFLVEMSMWLVKSRAGLVLEKRHFYFVMLFLFFFFPPGLLGLGYNREDLFSRGGLGALGFGLNWGLEAGMGFAEWDKRKMNFLH